MALDPALERITREHVAVLDDSIQRTTVLLQAAVKPDLREQVKRSLEILEETRRLLLEQLA